MSEDTKLAVEENEIKNPPAVEEETIFPKEVPVAAKLPSKSLWSFSVINFVGLILIAGAAFFLGYSTSPEQFDDSFQKVKT